MVSNNGKHHNQLMRYLGTSLRQPMADRSTVTGNRTMVNDEPV